MDVSNELLKIGQQLINLSLQIEEKPPTTKSSPKKTLKKTTKRSSLKRDLPKGVSKTKSGKYEARLYNPKNKKKLYLGVYLTPQEAEEAVLRELKIIR